jgi:hypothetical protein
VKYDEGKAHVEDVEIEDDADDAAVDQEGGEQSPDLELVDSPHDYVCEDVDEEVGEDAEDTQHQGGDRQELEG